MIFGVDSMYAPTPAQAQAAKALGHSWWGCYVSGSDASRIWTVADCAVLRQAGFSPLPICVPNQAETENPTAVGQQTVAACKARGILSGAVVLDFEHSANGAREPAFWAGWAVAVKAGGYVPVPYNGPHWGFPMPRWDPLPQAHQPTPARGQAIQWSSARIAGLSVDVNVADPAFPVGSWANPQPGPTPVPSPASPTVFPEDHMQAIPASVQIGSGVGWIPVPAGFVAAQVLAVTINEQSPSAVGRYVPIPQWDGNCGDHNELTFGSGPFGTPPDGTYGITVWVATA